MLSTLCWYCVVPGTRGVVLWLQGLGVSPAFAHRAAVTLGPTTQRLIQEDPYDALLDVPGYNWKVVEQVTDLMFTELK